MYCPNCGTKISDEGKSCPSCGIDVSGIGRLIKPPNIHVGVKSDKIPTKPSKAGRRIFFGLLTLLLICAVGGFVLIGFNYLAIGTSPQTEESIRSSPKVRWSIKYFGQSPIISGGKVFLINPDGFPTALEISSGKQIWTSEYDAGSMVATGDSIIIARPNHRLYSLNAENGTLNWKYFPETSTISQVIAGEGIIVTHSGGTPYSGGATITAISASNGNPIWNISADIYDILDKAFGGKVYVTSCCGMSNYAIKADTGEVLNYPIQIKGIVDINENSVYVVDGEENYMRYVLAFDATEHKELWRKETCTIGSVYGNTVFHISGSESRCYNLEKGHALDLYTGVEKWSWEFNALGNVVDGNSSTVYFFDRQNIVHAIKPDTGVEKWRNDEIQINHVVCEDTETAYFLGKQALYAIDANTGSKRWSVDIAKDITSAIEIGDKILLWTDIDLYLIDKESGKQLWVETLSSKIENVTFSNGMLFIRTSYYNLTVYK